MNSRRSAATRLMCLGAHKRARRTISISALFLATPSSSGLVFSTRHQGNRAMKSCALRCLCPTHLTVVHSCFGGYHDTPLTMHLRIGDHKTLSCTNLQTPKAPELPVSDVIRSLVCLARTASRGQKRPRDQTTLDPPGLPAGWIAVSLQHCHDLHDLHTGLVLPDSHPKGAGLTQCQCSHDCCHCYLSQTPNTNLSCAVLASRLFCRQVHVLS